MSAENWVAISPERLLLVPPSQKIMLTSHKVDQALQLLFRDIDILECGNLEVCSSGTLKTRTQGKNWFLPQLLFIRAPAPCCFLEPGQQTGKCWGWLKVQVWSKMLNPHQATHWGTEIPQLAWKLGCKMDEMVTWGNQHGAAFIFLYGSLWGITKVVKICC